MKRDLLVIKILLILFIVFSSLIAFIGVMITIYDLEGDRSSRGLFSGLILISIALLWTRRDLITSHRKKVSRGGEECYWLVGFMGCGCSEVKSHHCTLDLEPCLYHKSIELGKTLRIRIKYSNTSFQYWILDHEGKEFDVVEAFLRKGMYYKVINTLNPDSYRYINPKDCIIINHKS